MGSLELRILTLNIWGIPYKSRDRDIRIDSISSHLSTGEYDIVSLQEVWSQYDYEKIKQNTEEVLPYTHYFYSGVMGAGLMVLSKYPIVSALFHAWSVNGYFHRVQHADWFGGKGVGLCKILINGKIVNVYNAHLHAEYDNDFDEYKTHRVIQAFETAQFIKETRGNSILQILAGDLNTQPHDISYKIILHLSKMFDSCPHKHIATHECVRNSYTSKMALEKYPLGIRIDHIFLRGAKNYQVSVNEYLLPLPNRIPGHKISFSDHEAVLIKLKLIASDDISASENHEKSNFCIKGSNDSNYISRCEDVLQESIKLCEHSLEKLKVDRIVYYSIAVVLTFLLFALIDYSVPFGFKSLYLLLKFTLFGFILFSFFMGSIWNYMERNGILSGKMEMEIKSRSLQNVHFRID